MEWRTHTCEAAMMLFSAEFTRLSTDLCAVFTSPGSACRSTGAAPQPPLCVTMKTCVQWSTCNAWTQVEVDASSVRSLRCITSSKKFQRNSRVAVGWTGRIHHLQRTRSRWPDLRGHKTSTDVSSALQLCLTKGVRRMSSGTEPKVVQDCVTIAIRKPIIASKGKRRLKWPVTAEHSWRV
jgi:hypothetical protein